MSKKEDIELLLAEGYSTKDIMEEIDASRSYISNIKSEAKKSKGDSKDPDKPKGDHLDGDNKLNSGGDGSEGERDKETLESKRKESEPDKTNRLGGIKTEKVKKEKVEKKIEDEDGDETEYIGGVVEWIKSKSKMILSGLTVLSLLILGTLLLSKKNPKESIPRQKNRFPVLNH